MAEDTIAFVFPAFISDHRDDPSHGVLGFSKVFQAYLSRAADSVDKELLSFHPESNPMLQDELRNQYISYIYGCSCAGILMKSGVKPAMTAGYSMGIYASLYTAGSISFETGLLFIQKAYEAIRKVLPHGQYGMGGVIGLSEKDIRDIAGQHNLNLMIVNRNSDYSFTVAGNSFHINVFLLKAREEGALHARSLGVTVPYHTNLLSEAAIKLSETVYTAEVRAPEIPIISALSQNLIINAERARMEVVNNIHNPFNWLATQVQMFSSGIRLFTECGPSQALRKNSKFIPGAGKFVNWNTLIRDNVTT
ncbi:MAG: acyltransferase domain-containing protein [Bacteroidetes bacterium]|nr:acyltransferase domain-containing protein [Bacteroidota bacterium]